MRASLYRFEQLLDIVIRKPGRQAQLSRMYPKRLRRRFLRRGQAKAQEVIDRCLEGGSRPARLLAQKTDHIVIQSKSGSHIKMLIHKAS